MLTLFNETRPVGSAGGSQGQEFNLSEALLHTAHSVFNEKREACVQKQVNLEKKYQCVTTENITIKTHNS